MSRFFSSTFLSSALGKTLRAPTFPKPWNSPQPGACLNLEARAVHLGIILALLAIAALYFVLNKTVWGYEMRTIGGNAEAALRKGLPIGRYVVLGMFVAGGIAGMAGMGEVMAIQGRLRPGISPGYGYMGFLISWLAGHSPIGAVLMAFLIAVIALGGDTLQITQSMPYSTVNILMALILFIVLGGFFQQKKTA